MKSLNKRREWEGRREGRGRKAINTGYEPDS